MKLTTLLIALAGLALLAMLIPLIARRGRRATGKVSARRPLTEREQSMFFRLTATYPQHVVLTQVAFSALVDTRDRPTRNTFNRKVADFVLCDKSFAVIAVIELDDKSHRGREATDADRDAILVRAGYRVLRFKNVPDSADLLTAMGQTSSA